MRSLRTWLALALALAVALPAAVGVAAWLGAGEWQRQREASRLSAGLRELAGATLEDPGLDERLTRLGVEAELRPNVKAAGVFVDKARMIESRFATSGLDAIVDGPDGKRRITDGFVTASVALPQLEGTLLVRRESAAARGAFALAAAGLALAAALVLMVALLNRWVLRPLASLAGDADRIAGGELSVTPVRTRAGEVARVGDALEGMAGALGTALDASAAAERERRFLVSAIAHDLRTPLFTLRGSLEAIEHGLGDGDALARAQRKASHLDKLVGELFAFARAEYARSAQTREALDLADVARRAAEAVEPGDLRLVLIGTGGPARVHGDPVALQRVLTNLLDNAIRHARSRVEVAVSPGRVEIADDGPGFASEDLPHVFEPLYRSDKARSGGGAGLGLAIARRLARSHGGDVEAANAASGGARVTVTLP